MVNKMNWISIEDRLPDIDKRIYLKGGIWSYGILIEKNVEAYGSMYTNDGYFDNEDNIGEHGDCWYDVTHWAEIE
jgi:hypothetical protein